MPKSAISLNLCFYIFNQKYPNMRMLKGEFSTDNFDYVGLDKLGR